jgi:phosphocarrier protein
MSKGGKGAAPSRILVRDFKVLNRLGMHARPAAMFVKAASRFESEISVERNGNTVSGKSIMGLMTLEAGHGTVLRVTADGWDAEDALNALQQLVDGRFFED